MIVPLLAAGCATQRSVTVPTQAAQQPPVVAAASPTKAIETRYEVRGYREATNPQVRHEAHAVPRTAYPVASYTPLPASDELAAELATQRSITADIRTIRTSMVETERRVQSQYATLVRESAEALKVREQLEAERARARAAVPASTSAAPVAAPAGGTAEVKW
jgi:predicted outer membrane protein